MAAEWAKVLLIQAVKEEEVDKEYLPASMTSILKVGHLMEHWQAQLKASIQPDMFQKYLSWTSIVEHKFFLKSDTVVKQISYRIPQRRPGALKKDETLMLSLGCNTVLVPQKNGTIHFCIDFRDLNLEVWLISHPADWWTHWVSRSGMGNLNNAGGHIFFCQH